MAGKSHFRDPRRPGIVYIAIFSPLHHFKAFFEKLKKSSFSPPKCNRPTKKVDFLRFPLLHHKTIYIQINTNTKARDPSKSPKIATPSSLPSGAICEKIAGLKSVDIASKSNMLLKCCYYVAKMLLIVKFEISAFTGKNYYNIFKTR